jgi:hypothetical protein
MLAKLKSKKGQGVSSEYSIVYVVVTITIISSAMLMKRAIAARFYDARDAIAKKVQEDIKDQGFEFSRKRTEWGATKSFNARIWLQYEPYYAEAVTTRSRDLDRVQKLKKGGYSGTFSEYETDRKGLDLESEQKPPREADLDRKHLSEWRWWDKDRYLENNN